jgi:hypothetical protein
MDEDSMKKLSTDKYLFFRITDYRFREIIYLQYQAFLREFIQKLTREMLKM